MTIDQQPYIDKIKTNSVYGTQPTGFDFFYAMNDVLKLHGQDCTLVFRYKDKDVYLINGIFSSKSEYKTYILKELEKK
jgi:hypothetical protein